MTAAQRSETAVLRVATGKFAPARVDEVQAMTVATGRPHHQLPDRLGNLITRPGPCRFARRPPVTTV